MIGTILGETLALDIMKVDLSMKKEFLAELKACRKELEITKQSSLIRKRRSPNHSCRLIRGKAVLLTPLTVYEV